MMIRALSVRGWLTLVVLALSAVIGGCQAHGSVAPLPQSVPWYNVSRPLTWKDLRGRAVLLDFFTPGCINCVHMLPVEDQLAQRYGKRLTIVGIDAPKFSDSATPQGLVDFIQQYHIQHPVLLDARLGYWNAWHVMAWPTLILVGPDGHVRARFIGEQDLSALTGPIDRALAAAPAADTLKPLPTRTMAMGGGALDAPGGIAVSPHWIAISDTGHNRVILAHRDGKVAAVVGGCSSGAFARPHGLAFHNGQLYVADTLGQRIRVVNPATDAITTLAGSGVRGFVNRGQYAADKAQLNSPWGVAWAGGHLYVGMAGDHDIWRYTPASGQIGPWAGSGREGLADGSRTAAAFAQSSGLSAHAGKLYVADPESSAIRSITLADGQVDTLIGQGLFKFGLRNGSADHALLQHAEDVIWLDGSVYIADTFNNALRRLDLATMQVTTVATGLKQPQALAALDAHTILVTEAGGNRVVAVHIPDGKVTTWPLTGLQPPTCPMTASVAQTRVGSHAH